VARSNMSIRRKDQNYQYRKAAARRAFSVIPKIYLQSFLKNNKRDRGKITMVPRLQSKQRYAK
jgi:hypothetical protein